MLWVAYPAEFAFASDKQGDLVWRPPQRGFRTDRQVSGAAYVAWHVGKADPPLTSARLAEHWQGWQDGWGLTWRFVLVREDEDVGHQMVRVEARWVPRPA